LTTGVDTFITYFGYIDVCINFTEPAWFPSGVAGGLMNGCFIEGAWTEGSPSLVSRNPSDTTDVIGDYVAATADDVEAAVASARQAFKSWSKTPIQTRFNILDAVGSELIARKEELGRLLSREEGKILRDGIAEVFRAGMIFKFAAGEAVRLAGECISSTRPGLDVQVTREALGVVAVITPWNFPLAIPAWKIAPALACGCTVVFKPASFVPASACALMDVLQRNGVPAGVVNMLIGGGKFIGDHLIGNHHVAGVSFTGSVAVGRGIAQACAARGARVQLEMGGKNPLVVLDDAELGKAVRIAADGAFFQTGQRCTASSRLIVTRGIHDQFVEALTRQISSLRVDHALLETTDIGPVVEKRPLEEIMQGLEASRRDGALLHTGGELLDRRTPGHFLSPALFVNTRNDMFINRTELFGPVAAVIKVADYDEALATANDTEFGLSAGLCTQSLRHARHFQQNAESGLVMVNLPTAGLDYHVPFGGRKGSNYGPREQGSYAREFFTIVKTSYIDAN
jgi:aldehyde dehydrogenase (NAD+)